MFNQASSALLGEKPDLAQSGAGAFLLSTRQASGLMAIFLRKQECPFLAGSLLHQRDCMAEPKCRRHAGSQVDEDPVKCHGSLAIQVKQNRLLGRELRGR